MTKYILRDGKAVPYDGDRLNTDTRTWRDATELELEQRAELEHMDWKVENLEHRCNKLREERDRLLTLAVKWCDKNHHDWEEIEEMSEDTKNEDTESLANARLIAAAPDLLEACENLMVCMKLAGWEDDAVAHQARAAINKAKGEQ